MEEEIKDDCIGCESFDWCMSFRREFELTADEIDAAMLEVQQSAYAIQNYETIFLSTLQILTDSLPPIDVLTFVLSAMKSLEGFIDTLPECSDITPTKIEMLKRLIAHGSDNSKERLVRGDEDEYA